MEVPEAHPLCPSTEAILVISLNFKFPWFKYNLLSPWFDTKYKSKRPSLLISPADTPPPL